MKIASFTYHGSSPNKDREVELHQNPEGTYTVSIEGMTALSQTTRDKDKAEEIFDGWWQMAQKDWGSSEIDWNE